MSRLITEIASFIEKHARSHMLSLPDGDAEWRSAFHGPPVPYLREALALLAEDGGIECQLRDGKRVVCPVLLPIEGDDDDTGPLAVGTSGTCSREHLIALRNTPYGKRWVALNAPGSHDAKSVTGASEDFGILPVNNGGTASIADWLHDRFVAALVDRAIERIQWSNDVELRSARSMAESALHAAAAADRHDFQRPRAWMLISRLLDVSEGPLTAADQWSLECGMPPSGDGSLRHDLQRGVLDDIADLIQSEGFGACATKLKLGATEDEASAVDEMVAHLRDGAEVAIALERGIEHYYAPGMGNEPSSAPEWWKLLTAARLRELLGDEAPRPETLGLEVIDPLIRAGAGLPAVVVNEARLQLTLPSGDAGPVDVLLAREGAGRGNSRRWDVRVSENSEVVDDEVPAHGGPLRYVATADGYKRAAVRVVVLSAFAPGLVVTSRSATKMSVPKKARAGQAHRYECNITVIGEGRHFLDLHVGDGHFLGASAVGEDATTVGSEALEADVASPAEGTSGPWGVEIVATPECHYDIPVIGPDGDEFLVRLHVTCDDAKVEGCRSEFERLIRLNRDGVSARGTIEVQIDRQVRTADLQAWILHEASCDRSFHPLVIAPDCHQAWRAPNWLAAAGTVLSTGQFIHDPRPMPDEIKPPEEFVAARREIARKIRGEDGHGLVEAAQLGSWMLNEEFAEIVDTYVRSYRTWLDNDPDVASWIDIAMVAGLEADGALSQEPFAVLVNPMHPLRLGWHALAQRTLHDSWRSSSPCPAASILDPDSVPDAISLPLRTASGGIRRALFLSTDSNSDYWAVLWNAAQVSTLADKGAQAPFDREFGVQVGGVASGFSLSQVQRAMDDVDLLFAAKPVLNVLVTSATASGSACNDGLLKWAKDQFAPTPDKAMRILRMGSRLLQIFDDRRQSARPEDAEIANLAEDTSGAVKWFAGTPEGSRPDLGIIAQLETSNASANPTTTASPLGRGALLRHRVRTQLQAGGGAFLSESRMGAAGPPTGDALADHVSALVARLENLADVRLGYTFAPSIKTIHAVLNDKSAEYVAVSSSAVDPACFLGGWLEGAYLWDYDLPSYSNRPGDTSGYYLLSRVRPMDSDALLAAVARLPGCAQVEGEALQEILLEVSRRGIPTVRGLSAGHTGAAGDLGLFLAGRLLQDAFRSDARQDGLLPLVKRDGESHEIVLVVPVDPFRGYLLDLQRALNESTLQRPDILVFGISITPSRVAIRMTPVEVKFRQQVLTVPVAKEALQQARALSSLLARLHQQGDGAGLNLWKLASQHLMLSMLDFGLRVYSQREVIRREPKEWTDLHQRLAAALLGETAELEVDAAGRLVVFDATAQSTHRDLDQDGLNETIVISPSDAAKIVLDQAGELQLLVKAAVGDWRFLPTSSPRIVAGPGHVDDGASTPNVEPQSARSDFSALVEPGDRRAPSEADPVRSPEEGDAGIPTVAARPEKTAGNAGIGHEVSTGDPPTPSIATPEPIVAPIPHRPETPATGAPEQPQDAPDASADGRGVVVRVGSSVDGFRNEEMSFLPSMTSLTQLNIGVVGDLGTGKTQLVKSLVYQIQRAAKLNNGVTPRFLIFDYKKDYQEDSFVKAVSAKVVKPYQLPINLFDTTGVPRKPEWLPRFQFFADALDKIYSNIGPVQRSNLSKAVKAAHEAAVAHGRAATIYDVESQYEVVVGGRMDSVLSIMNDLTVSELFVRNPTAGASFDAFFDGVTVVSLSDLGQDDRSKNLLVAIFLNLFYEFMLRLPKRPYRGTEPQLRTIDSFLLVDEAEHIMKYEFDVLKSILLQGREFGVGTLLASQYLRHFKVGGTNYREPLLTWFIHNVPDLRPQELEALGMTTNLAQLADRVKQLQLHQCLYKTSGVAGSVVTGIPFYKLLGDTPVATPT